MRKTIAIKDLLVRVNNMLANSTCSSEVRQGMMGVLESVLHDTGNYKGFRYLAQAEVPAGHLPGIQQGEEKFANTDKTRVCYYA